MKLLIFGFLLLLTSPGILSFNVHICFCIFLLSYPIFLISPPPHLLLHTIPYLPLSPFILFLLLPPPHSFHSLSPPPPLPTHFFSSIPLNTRSDSSYGQKHVKLRQADGRYGYWPGRQVLKITVIIWFSYKSR